VECCDLGERIPKAMEKHTVLVSFKTIDGEIFTVKVHADSQDELHEKALKQVDDLLRGLIYGDRWEYVNIAVASNEDEQTVSLQNP
jgi:hypothetical protein